MKKYSQQDNEPPIKILVIDDDTAILKVMEEYLSSKGFTPLLADDGQAAIAASVILLAHSMNLKVVAEGVETKEQLEVLRQQGCDIVQGFLFSKPLAAEEFLPFFEPLLK